MSPSTSSKAQQQLIGELYLQHHDWLIQWLRYRIRHPFNAADIVQDTFVRLIQAKHKLASIQEPKAYLINIAKHVLIDQHRRNVIETNYLKNLYDEAQLGQELIQDNTIEDTIQILDFLSVALGKTTAKVRQSFILYYIEGYSQTEIAELTGKSLRSIQGYLANGLSLCYELRHKMHAECEE